MYYYQVQQEEELAHIIIENFLRGHKSGEKSAVCSVEKQKKFQSTSQSSITIDNSTPDYIYTVEKYLAYFI